MVGQCGVPPSYFLDEMKIYEVDLFLNGYEKRCRDGWEQTRTIAYMVAQVNSTKTLDPAKLLPFTWDKKEIKCVEATKEDIERLRTKAKYIEKVLNNG